MLTYESQRSDKLFMSDNITPTQCQADIIELIKAMIHKEKSAYLRPMRYSIAAKEGGRHDQLTGAWRLKICEWIFEVVDYFSFDRQAVAIALDYLDRSASILDDTSSDDGIDRREYQLLAISSLYLAIKLHGESETKEGLRLKMKVSAFEQLGRGMFQASAIEETERKILALLRWQLNPPIPSQYVAYLVRLVPRWPANRTASFRTMVMELHDTTKYLTELACFNLVLTFDVDPSIVAYGALMASLEILATKTPFPHGTYTTFLHNLANINPAWTPFNRDVILVQETLRDISPITFQGIPLHVQHLVTSRDEPIPTVYTPEVRILEEGDTRTSRTRSPNCVSEISLADCPNRKRHRTEPTNHGVNQSAEEWCLSNDGNDDNPR